MEDDERRSGEQDAKLIGLELRAAHSIQAKPELRLLDSILAVAPHHVLAVQLLRRSREIRDDVTNIVLGSRPRC